jgi:ribonuclease HII
MSINKGRYKYLIGIDEVGRGPLAGPVNVCAFCVPVENEKEVLEKLSGITDSKKLSQKRREAYFEIIKQLKDDNLISAEVSGVSAKIIDQKGIMFALNASLVSALDKLAVNPSEVFICLDGGLYAPEKYNQETIIKGDSKIWQIGAASVLAKVLRDRKMVEYGKKYPEYGFENHKGYGTQKHRDALKEYGAIDIHRKSWLK